MTNRARGIDVSAREHVVLPHGRTRLEAALCRHSTAGELRHVAFLEPLEQYGYLTGVYTRIRDPL